MAAQGPDRRAILKLLSIAATVSSYPGFSRWAYAQEHVHDAPVTPRPAHYEPKFFRGNDYHLVERLSELIIPTDETPGAKEAGVAEFIDFMVWSDPALQSPFQSGIHWLDEHSSTALGKRFLDLQPEQQTEILQHLAFRQHQTPEIELGRKFFSQFREYTLMGFYTTRIGLEQLDYPGFRSYSHSPECPHHDDPAHAHLQSR